MQHKAGAGRPRALSKREVQQHVRTPILRANRAHKAVHYSKLLPGVQQKTGKELSLRTLQRYGKDVVIPIVPSMHVAKTVTSAHAAACLCLAFSLQQTQ